MKSMDDNFEKEVHEHYEALFRFAISLTHSESDAWDLTQQTYYILATKGHQIRDFSKIKSWLFTTLHRAFLEKLRKQSRISQYELENPAVELPTVSPKQFDRADSSQALAALARVDQTQQAVLALFYLENYHYKEIAAILELPIGTVKSRIARGIAQLRKLLLPETSVSECDYAERDFSPAVLEEPIADC